MLFPTDSRPGESFCLSEFYGNGVLLRGGEDYGDSGGAVGGLLAADAALFDGGYKAGFLYLEGHRETGLGCRLVNQADSVAVLPVLALGEADIAVAIGIEGTGGIDGAAIG